MSSRRLEGRADDPTECSLDKSIGQEPAMNLSERAVIVKEVPPKCSTENSRTFLRDLTNAMEDVVRPAIVLDCSHACKIDKQAIHLFLCCLEEAMKRNGDVRIAALHQDAWQVLESAGIARLFRNFRTTAEAVDSYRRRASLRQAFATSSSADAPATSAA